MYIWKSTREHGGDVNESLWLSSIVRRFNSNWPTSININITVSIIEILQHFLSGAELCLQHQYFLGTFTFPHTVTSPHYFFLLLYVLAFLPHVHVWLSRCQSKYRYTGTTDLANISPAFFFLFLHKRLSVTLIFFIHQYYTFVFLCISSQLFSINTNWR